MKCMKNSPERVAEFLNEVKAITGISHKNLVKLKGYCLRDKNVILVYEYVENKDLQEALFKHKGTTWFKPRPYKMMQNDMMFPIICMPSQLNFTFSKRGS